MMTINKYLFFFIFAMPFYLLIVPNNSILAILLLLFLIIVFFKHSSRFTNIRLFTNYYKSLELSVLLIVLFYDFINRWASTFNLSIISYIIGIILVFLSYIFLNSLEMNDSNSEGLNDNNYSLRKNDFIFCIAIAVFVSLFDEIRPFSLQQISTDSSVFLYIGRQMLSGKIPYKDMFDHKGIVLYFIQYIAALIDNNGFIGIWITNMLAMFFTFVMLTKIGKLYTKNDIHIYISEALLSLIYILRFDCVDINNVTEVYSLPFISYAMFIFLLFIKTRTYRKRNIFFLGLSFTVVFFIRCNIVSIWGIICLIVAIILFKENRYHDILMCGIYFAFGCIAVLVPLLLYFIYTKSLFDMIYCYLLFNFIYISSYGILKAFISMLHGMLILFAIPLLIHNMFLIKKEKTAFYNIICFIVSLFFAYISGRDYPHYSIILLPNIYVMLIITFSRILNEKITYTFSNGLINVLIVVAALLIVISIKPFEKTKHNVDSIEKYILENTSINDNVLITGNNCKYYLYTNRTTKNKFMYTMTATEEIIDYQINEIENNKPDYIIVTKPKGHYDGDLFFDKIDGTDLYDYVTFDKFYVYKIKNNFIE